MRWYVLVADDVADYASAAASEHAVHFSDEEQESIKKSVLGALREIGVDEKDISQLLGDWHRTTEFDYAYHILGGRLFQMALIKIRSIRGKHCEEAVLITFPHLMIFANFLATTD